jgi:restriction endonuclease S subunit
MKKSKNKNSSVDVPEVFFIWSDELQDRFDPFFYRPVFKKLLEVIANNKTEKITLKEAITNSVAGDWGEDPIDFEPNPDYELCYVVRNTNFHNDFNLDFSDVAQRYIKKSKAEKLALQKGDILIEKSGGSPIQPVGRVALVDDLPFDKPVVFSNFLQKMEVNKELFLPEYVFVYLQALYKIGYMDFIQNQTTGIKNLRLDDFFKILIIKPSIAAQKKVALKAIESREEAKGLLEKAKTILASIDSFVLGELGIEIERERERVTFAIASDEIEGRIDPFFYKPYFKALKKMIESKNYSVLGELVEFANETWDQKTVFDNQFPYIEISNIDTSNGEIAKTDFVPVAEAPSRARMIVREGDIIVSTTRPNRGAITPISKEQDGFIASTGFAILRDLKNGKILKDYLFIALRTSLSLQQMEQRTTGGNYPAITIEDLKKIKIVVPEIKVQEKIIAGVKTIYEKAKGLRHEAGDVVIVAQKQVEQMIFA